MHGLDLYSDDPNGVRPGVTGVDLKSSGRLRRIYRGFLEKHKLSHLVLVARRNAREAAEKTEIEAEKWIGRTSSSGLGV